MPNSLGPLIRDLDWNEDLRLTDWLAVVDRLRGENMPAVMQAAIAWEAWQDIEPLQHQHWLGTLLVAALLRQTGKVGSHLFCLHAGLRIVPRDRRKSPLRTTRLLAALDAFAEAAAAGLKEHDRLVMGKGQMERRLRKRRKNSSLPALIELVLARPVVSAGLIAAELKISQRAALDLVAELGIREVTGRGRYRAWGFI
ncbi:RHE_PE00001 family protein [Mesorhizobium sp.]|uniref:RHE_PE00001 family protein n=1 Tax=Mesorhizobium sp. TaxID=1871066 RepID=UPI00257A976F|nr:RHE_PE00001 family protein [Mesorhizobium sp.]